MTSEPRADEQRVSDELAAVLAAVALLVERRRAVGVATEPAWSILFSAAYHLQARARRMLTAGA